MVLNTACLPCLAGAYSITAGITAARSCLNCTAGQYSLGGGSACLACGAGRYATGVGSTAAGACTPCPAGRFSLQTGAGTFSACLLCGQGVYSGGAGSTACAPCPPNSNSSGGASVCRASVGYFLDYRPLESYTGNGTISAVPNGTFIALNRDFAQDSVLGGVSGDRPITILSANGRTTLVQDGRVLASDNGYPRLLSPTTGAFLVPYVWYKFDSADGCSWDSSGNQRHSVPSSLTACLTEFYNGLYYPSGVYAIKGDMSAMFRSFGGTSVSRVSIPVFNWELVQRTSGLSIVLWANYQAAPSFGAYEMVLSMYGVPSGSNKCDSAGGLQWTLYNTGGIKSEMLVEYFFDGGSSELSISREMRPGVSMMDGKWHHHVLSIAPDGRWSMWVDGIDMNISRLSNLSVAPAGYDRVIEMGGSSCNNIQNLFAGIDDFRIYPATLTAHHAQELYAGTVGVYTVGYSQCNTTANPCPLDTTLHCTTGGLPVCCGYGTYFLEGASNACMPCEVGTNSDGSGSTCMPCPVGQYLRGRTCLDCIAGTYASTLSQSACTACLPGSYGSTPRANTSLVCTNCSAGTYQPTPAATSSANCTVCPTGTYLPQVGASSALACVQCGAGKYSEAARASSPDVCQNCAPGTFSTGLGLSNRTWCAGCSAGAYSTTAGAALPLACLLCRFGHYASTIGSTACDACPSLSNTSSAGSTTRGDCVCLPGAFGIPETFQTCVPCPANSFCNSTTRKPCPYGTLSFPGAVSVSQCGCSLNASAPLLDDPPTGCRCDPGFQQRTNGLSLGGWDCRACEADTYCLAGVQSVCPDFSTAPALSRSILDCGCRQGYYWNGTLLLCFACPVHAYCRDGGVLACPANTFSPMRSSSQADCRCSAGYQCTRARDTRLTITFRLDGAQFEAQQAVVRQKLAQLAGVPESAVVLNATNGVALRRLLSSPDRAGPVPRYIEISAYVPVQHLPGDVMILH